MNQSTFQNLNQAHLLFIELSKAINEVLDEQDINISREQMGVFKLLNEHGSLTINEIAEAQGVFKTAISKRISKLQQMGFVIKQAGHDKREKLVYLTEKGIHFYETRQMKLYQGLMDKFHINDQQVAEILGYLEQIKRTMNS